MRLVDDRVFHHLYAYFMADDGAPALNCPANESPHLHLRTTRQPTQASVICPAIKRRPRANVPICTTQRRPLSHRLSICVSLTLRQKHASPVAEECKPQGPFSTAIYPTGAAFLP